MTDDQVAKLARATVVVLGLISLVPRHLQFHHSGVASAYRIRRRNPIFPGVVLGLYWKRVTMPAVFAGMIAGIAAVSSSCSATATLLRLERGVLALCLNFLITVFVSLATPSLRMDLTHAQDTK